MADSLKKGVKRNEIPRFVSLHSDARPQAQVIAQDADVARFGQKRRQQDQPIACL
jgi:hypothetical protein